MADNVFVLKHQATVLEESTTPFFPNKRNNCWENPQMRIPDHYHRYRQVWKSSGELPPPAQFRRRWPEERKEAKLNYLNFLLLFTTEERVAIKTAQAYSGVDTTEIAKKITLDDMFSILQMMNVIDLTSSFIESSMQYLVDEGFITSGRANEILLVD